MADEGFKRKLTAILSADVVGYSLLMDNNEEATVRILNDSRASMTELILQYRGRVVDATGDNILAEFASAVDAVNCAAEIQRELAERNAELPYERKMEFRIGVNVGDVVEEEDRIYGDGVNIAARVEGLAEAGGICISGRVYDHVENKLDLEYDFLGEKEVKNITRPIRVYRVLSYPGAAAHRVISARKTFRRKWRRIVLSGATVLMLCLAAIFFIWNIYFRLPLVEIASAEELTLKFPDGPSVAVLPFVNLSDDPEQEYFSDGLTENLITGLSACPKLLVIASNSSFVYKSKPVDVQKVASDLGVQYLIEGSVQKSGNRVRVVVQLIDAITGHHLWADKYDRDLKEIFVIQDDITIKVITALQVKLTEGEQARVRLKAPATLETFLKALKAYALIRRHNKNDNILARQEVKEAIVLSPNFSGGYVLLAFTHMTDLWFGEEYPIFSFAEATKNIKKALSLDKDNSDAYLALSYLNLMRKQHEQAIASGNRAVILNPNGADAYAQLGYALYSDDRLTEAVQYLQRAIRLNPIPPSSYYHFLGHAYVASEDFKRAIEAYKRAIELEPNDLFAHVGLTGTYVLSGQFKEAQDIASEVLRIDPNYSTEKFEKTSPQINKIFVKKFYSAVRQAGLD